MAIRRVGIQDTIRAKSIEYKGFILIFEESNDEEEIRTAVRCNVQIMYSKQKMLKIKFINMELRERYSYDAISKELAEKIIADKKYQRMTDKQLLSLIQM